MVVLLKRDKNSDLWSIHGEMVMEGCLYIQGTSLIIFPFFLTCREIIDNTGKENGINIVMPERTYHLIAESAEDARWAVCLSLMYCSYLFTITKEMNCDLICKGPFMQAWSQNDWNNK